MNTFAVTNIRDAAQPLLHSYGFKTTTLFASYANATATASDIDAYAQAPIETKTKRVFEFAYDLGKALGAKVDAYGSHEARPTSTLPPLEWGKTMIPRIKTLETLPNYTLALTFDDGRSVLYDMQDDIATLPSYDDLERIEGLFAQARLDESRTCVVWNENIDLPSDILYEYGKEAALA